MNLSQLADEIQAASASHELLQRLANDLEGGADACAYCARPGTRGTLCRSCGAYVESPRKPAVALEVCVESSPAGAWEPATGSLAILAWAILVLTFFWVMP